MGLFSSKKTYTVNVTVSPVFEEEQIPTSALNGLIKGIMQEQDIVPSMLDEISQCMGIRAMTALHNTQMKGYEPGIPSAQVATYIQAKDQVISAIEANIGRQIDVEYYYMGPLNSMHFGWQYCHDSLGYNVATNELTVLSASTGFPCYLSDMKATYLREDFDWMIQTNDTGMLAQLGPSPRSGFRPSAPYNMLSGIGQYAQQPAYEVSDVSTEDYVTIQYEFQNASGAFETRGITVSMASLDNIADFHMCRYKDSTGKTGFFTYLHGSGTYPSIDLAYALEHSPLGTYFPWAYFRHHGQDAYDIESATSMGQMKAWCEQLGVSYDQLYDGVHEDPNVDDTEQSLLLMAINPGHENQACREYLFKHFSALHANALPQVQLDPSLEGKLNAFTSSPSQMQHIRDNRFAMSFQFSGISKRRVPGKIANKNRYNSHFGILSQDSQNYLTQTPIGTGVDNAFLEQPGWIYQYQVNDSVYEEIIVYGLRVNYQVHSKKGFAASRQDKELLIPLDSAIVQTMSVPAREQLLCRSLTMMVNTVIITKSPWYASSAFRIILLVIAVVITILSAGSAWQTVVAAWGVGIGALAVVIITTIVKTMVISYGIKLFTQAVGPKVALIVALVAVIYGNTTAATEASATWAENLVQMGTSLVKEAGELSQQQLAAGLKDIVEDAEAFSAWAQDQMDGLTDNMLALGLNPAIVGLNAFDVVKMGPRLVLGENPSDYYARTVHAGNIGTLAFDMTESFVAIKTSLPTFNQTQESFNYGGD
jgi:hypothetical protein